MKYLWKCTSCETYEEVERPMKDSQVAPDWPCFNCMHQEYARVYENPMVLKASFLDGQQRPGWKDMKRAAKLEVEKGRANSNEERAGLDKEIKALRKIT